MAQGGFKLNPNKPNSKKSKPTHQKQKQLSKGRKTFAAKGRKKTQARQDDDTTKAINRKNEITVAARVMSTGNKFAMKDLKDAGKKEIGKQNQTLRRKESKSLKMSGRLREQVEKLK